MLNRKNKFSASLVLCTILGLTLSNISFANRLWEKPEPAPQIDLVIALDVSGSMEGLIASAKQRLWDIVNQMERAQPKPDLRISIVTYGNPEYGEQSGFVKIDLPFTRNLDAVNQTLFSFDTNGGDEFVARAITAPVNNLRWSTNKNALRILFVAGNEGANQDPQISLEQATQLANSKGIVVNTIYCGGSNDGDAAGWRDVASMTNGLYASINQDSAAVANIATPMDAELTALNQELNETYVAYGVDGKRSQDNQIKQDQNAGAMSTSAAASRAVTKAGKLYDTSGWDLVSAVGSGKALEEFDVEDLPEPMKDMDDEEREEFLTVKAEKRKELQAEIQELARDRRAYIESERKKQSEDAPKALDEVIQEGLKSQAEQKGFTFED